MDGTVTGGNQRERLLGPGPSCPLPPWSPHQRITLAPRCYRRPHYLVAIGAAELSWRGVAIVRARGDARRRADGRTRSRMVPFPSFWRRSYFLWNSIMSRPSLVLAIASAATLCALPSLAEPRSGPSLHLLGGAGYSTGNYAFEGMSHPNYGVPLQPLTFESTVAGPVLTAAVQPGWWLTPHVGLAMELGCNVQLGGSDGGLAQSRINQTLGWQGLVLIDAHLSDGPGLHLQAGGGFASVKFLWEKNDLGSYDNIVEPSPVGGATGFLGVGYELSGSFGLVLRTSYARLSNDDSHFRPVSLGLLADISLL